MGSLTFDLQQKWAKGLRISFLNERESADLKKEDLDFLKQVRGRKVVEWRRGEDFSTVEADGFFAGSSFKDSKRKLMIRAADCAPLFYIDRESERIAAIHAGWRGLSLGIHKVPFDQGFDPKTTWIWCGPCLNGTSFEVEEDMWSKFSPNDQRLYFSETENPKKRFFRMWDFLEGSFKNLEVELFYNVEVDTFTTPEFSSNRRWKKSGGQGQLQHNYSWIGFT